MDLTFRTYAYKKQMSSYNSSNRFKGAGFKGKKDCWLKWVIIVRLNSDPQYTWETRKKKALLGHWMGPSASGLVQRKHQFIAYWEISNKKPLTTVIWLFFTVFQNTVVPQTVIAYIELAYLIFMKYDNELYSKDRTLHIARHTSTVMLPFLLFLFIVFSYPFLLPYCMQVLINQYL